VTEQLLELICISLASAFLANLITLQNGPMMIFSALRMLVGSWTAKRSNRISGLITHGALPEYRMKWELRKNKIYKSIAEIFSCPWCLGPWIVFIFVAIFANDRLIFNWLVASGLLYVFLGVMNGRSK